MTFMVYKNRILPSLQGFMFWRTYKNSSTILYGYDNILLKLYLEIANTGDFSKLVISGKYVEAECLSSWEQIIKRQEKTTGSNQYNLYLQLLKGYALLLNDHKNIRAALIHVAFAHLDWEVISFLASKGYEINTSDKLKTLEDVNNGLRRNENLITKATMKSKQLHRMFANKEIEQKEAKGFEEILANLNFALGFNVDENITLARYNEYQKILKAKQSKAEEDGRVKRK